MFGRFVRDESGITMALTVIMIVLIGVMGAGLLTFVARDLDTVIEVNQGQKAFEMADAGIQAAQRQLEVESRNNRYDSIPTHPTPTNPAADDPQWSKQRGGITLNNLDNDTTTTDSVDVTIEKTSTNRFTIISTGHYDDAKRKIEARYKISTINIPPAYASRDDVTIENHMTIDNFSVFAEDDMTITNNNDLANDTDTELYKWATPSYPNDFNSTPRASDLIGLGVGGRLTLENSSRTNIGQYNGTRNYANSYSYNTPPSGTPRFVKDVNADGVPGQQSSEMTFPFDMSAQQDALDIDALRRIAKRREAQTGYNYYRNTTSAGTPIGGSYSISSVDTPGAAGASNTSWPSNSQPDTVVFYDYPSYSDTNIVNWTLNYGCPDTSTRGIIVVNNGNFKIRNHTSFTGAIIVRSGNVVDDDGVFTGENNSCISGYVNASGTISFQNSFDIGEGGGPVLSEEPAFRDAKLISWRELYK